MTVMRVLLHPPPHPRKTGRAGRGGLRRDEVNLEARPEKAILVQQTDTTCINGTCVPTTCTGGRKYTSVYTAAAAGGDPARTTVTTSPFGRITKTSLDGLGRVISTQLANLAKTLFDYDCRGRLRQAVQDLSPPAPSADCSAAPVPGAAARVTRYGYDSRDRLSFIIDPLSRVTSFLYDNADRVLQQTLPDGRQIQFTYDASGNLTSLTTPSAPSTGSGHRHVFEYTPVNLQSKYTPPDVTGVADTSTLYTYNLDHQLDLVTGPDGRQIDYQYDGAGRLFQVVTPSGNYQYSYFSASETASGQSPGLLKQITAPGGGTLAYTYDGSLLKNATWGNGPVRGTVGRTYDTSFRITSLTVTPVVGSPSSVNFGYDTDLLLTSAGSLTIARDSTNGLITGPTLGSVTTSNAYNTFGELSAHTASYGAGTLYQENLDDISSPRDKLGRITRKIETLQGTPHTYDYFYDAAG